MIPPAVTYQPNAMVALVATFAHQVICWLAQPTLTASMVFAVMRSADKHWRCFVADATQSHFGVAATVEHEMQKAPFRCQHPTMARTASFCARTAHFGPNDRIYFQRVIKKTSCVLMYLNVSEKLCVTCMRGHQSLL